MACSGAIPLFIPQLVRSNTFLNHLVSVSSNVISKTSIVTPVSNHSCDQGPDTAMNPGAAADRRPSSRGSQLNRFQSLTMRFPVRCMRFGFHVQAASPPIHHTCSVSTSDTDGRCCFTENHSKTYGLISSGTLGIQFCGYGDMACMSQAEGRLTRAYRV